MIELKSYGFMTEQGPHLNLNEDSGLVDLENNLFVVVDGFGGSNIGDRCAALICESLKQSYTKIAGDPDSTLPFFYSYRYLIEGNALINAFHVAHQKVMKENEAKSMNHRGGGSVISAALAENILTLVSTGNCKAYLFREGELKVELLPDSLASISRHSQTFLQTAPMSGMGLFEDLHYQVREIKLATNDLVLLFTDGIYARVSDEEIKSVIHNYSESELDIISGLIKLANDRGNLDNQTALILKF